ncbi:MAG TPA: hypothetical protein VHM90_15630 [Phycisphaerae bacterium]|nr:hypothetical protein [Phycisphaerae bacterium]
MAVFFLVLISIGIIVGTGVYIAAMNRVWFGKEGEDQAQETRRPPEPGR